MKIFVKLAIVLIVIGTIFSFSAVAAERPENPPLDGPLTDISDMLSDIFDKMMEILEKIEYLQVSMDDNFTDIDSDLGVLESDLDEFRADVDDNFTVIDLKLTNIQESLASSDMEVIYHTSQLYLSVDDKFNISCRNSNASTTGNIALIIRKWNNDEWQILGTAYWNDVDYHMNINTEFEEPGIYTFEIDVSSKEIFCTACIITGDDINYCYLPNDFYIQYL
jgi:hypothetical protein